MILSELKDPKLKKELEKRSLSVDGSKSALRVRLREAMEKEGLNANHPNFGGEVGDSATVENTGDVIKSLFETAQVPTRSFDLPQLMAAMSQMMEPASRH